MWWPVINLLVGVLLFQLRKVQCIAQQPLAHAHHLLIDDTSKLLDLHKFLVETESISGNEHFAGVQLTAFLRAHNFTVELQVVPPLASNPHKRPRYNVFAYRGNRKTPVLVTSHIDTVPNFYSYEVRNTTDIWGRGSVDAKGCVAAQITALLILLREGLVDESDVALLFVVGEEVNGQGMQIANQLGLEWDSVIFGEPTEGKLASGHKGAMLLDITAHGKAGHSGYPWLGENANSILLHALLALEKTPLPWSDKFGNTTLNIGKLSGGVAANVIAEKASASVQLRLAAGKPEEVKKHLTQVVSNVNENLDLEFGLGYGPVDCDILEGFETITVNYGTDIPHLSGNHKVYLYGPGNILVAHSDHEHLKIAALTEGVKGYQNLILGSLKRKRTLVEAV